MGLSSQDFTTAFRALSTRSCSPAAIRKALRVQSSRMVNGRPLTLAEALVEAKAISPFTAGELTGPAALDLRGDPESLTAAGELFLETETASEIELDRIIDGLTKPVDPRTLKDVPLPPSLGGYDISWEIGRSRTGSVYRGTQRGTNLAVAIKVFRKEVFATDAAKSAFLERMAAVPGEDGAGLIKVHEAKDVDGHAVVVQDFVEGASLDTLLA